MDIGEAGPADVRTVAGMSQFFPPGFPSAASLLRLLERLDILMPVACADTEIVGFALAALLTAEERRVGSVRYLFALVDDGPGTWAIQSALLSRLEPQCRHSKPTKSTSAACSNLRRSSSTLRTLAIGLTARSRVVPAKLVPGGGSSSSWPR